MVLDVKLMKNLNQAVDRKELEYYCSKEEGELMGSCWKEGRKDQLLE
jgi:hypothetical protein